MADPLGAASDDCSPAQVARARAASIRAAGRRAASIRMVGALVFRAASLGAAALGAACASASGPADDRAPNAPLGVIVDDHVVTYPVRGRTVAEVRRALGSAATGATLTGSYGEEHSSLRWQWNARASVGLGCELHDVRITVTSSITVPAWVADSAAEPGMAERWAAFDAALRRHERGHEAIAYATAGTLAQSLRHVRSARCADAGIAGNQLGAQAIDALQRAQRQYDDSTGHGRTQGATWPPPRHDPITPANAGSRVVSPTQ